MSAATRSPTKQLGFFPSNQIASFDYADRHDALATKVADCVVRAFGAVGAGSMTQEVVFSELWATKGVGRNDIVDKPEEFLAVVRQVYGEAGSPVFEYMLKREVKRQFELGEASSLDAIQKMGVADLIHLVAHLYLQRAASG